MSTLYSNAFKRSRQKSFSFNHDFALDEENLKRVHGEDNGPIQGPYQNDKNLKHIFSHIKQEKPLSKESANQISLKDLHEDLRSQNFAGNSLLDSVNIFANKRSSLFAIEPKDEPNYRNSRNVLDERFGAQLKSQYFSSGNGSLSNLKLPGGLRLFGSRIIEV